MKPRAAGRLNGVHRRFAVQLVASILLVSVPLMIILAVLLTRGASTSLTSSAEDKGGDVARVVTLRLEDWQAERQADMQIVAAAASVDLKGPGIDALLSQVDGPMTVTRGWMSWTFAGNQSRPAAAGLSRIPADRTGSAVPSPARRS